MPRRSLEEWFMELSGDVIVIGSVRDGRHCQSHRRFWEPKADLVEDVGHFILKIELAGVPSSNLQLAYLPDRHSLLVCGVRQDEDLPGTRKRAVHQLEIFYGEFEREFSLPDPLIDPEGIKAHYRSGFLYVLIPKIRSRIQYTRKTIFEA